MELYLQNNLAKYKPEVFKANVKYLQQLLNLARQKLYFSEYIYLESLLEAAVSGPALQTEQQHWHPFQSPEEVILANGGIIKLYPSHHTTYETIRSALELDPSQKILLVVYDQHLDFYLRISNPVFPDPNNMPIFDSMDEEKSRWVMGSYRGNCPFEVNKANFISALIEWGMISGVVFLGAEDHMEYFATSEDLTRYFYERHHEKIVCLPGNATSTDLESALSQLQQSNPFNHILTSVDIDVLRTGFGYSAMEYTGLDTKLMLGSVDLVRDWSEAEDDICAALDELYKSIFFYERSFVEGKPRINHRGTIPASALKKWTQTIIDWKSTAGPDVEIGINHPDGRIVADFVEAQGLDYKNRTERILAALIASLGNIFENT